MISTNFKLTRKYKISYTKETFYEKYLSESWDIFPSKNLVGILFV